MLRLVLPKGSLERATLQLFEDADLAVSRGSDVDYRGTIDDPRVDEVRILRPQEIPRYVADGMFDLGITGRDWIEERNAEVVTLTELHYSKATARPIRMVLAVGADSTAQTVHDLPAGLVVHTEYPELTRRYFEQHGVDADVQLSYGATEAKVPDIADAVVEITETGRALRAAGLRILDTILVSYTELIASPDGVRRSREAQGDGAAAEPAHRRARGARARAAEAQRRRRRPRRRDRAAAGAEVADGVEAVRRGRLRGRDRGGQERDQHADPRTCSTWAPTGSSSCRSPRSSRDGTGMKAVYSGRVVEFDDHARPR